MRVLICILAFLFVPGRVVGAARVPRDGRRERRAAVSREPAPPATGRTATQSPAWTWAAASSAAPRIRRGSRPHHQDRHPEYGDAAEQHLGSQRRQHRRVSPHHRGRDAEHVCAGRSRHGARRFSKARATARAAIASEATVRRTGPDLTDVGGQRRAAELEQSIVEPGAAVLPNHRSFRVVTRDGVAISGRLLNHDAFTVQLLDSKEQLRSFQKSTLREYAFVDSSPMPSYRDRLSAEELADLVSYLVSLKGRVTP